ncbi:hypothetical protein F4811DRAFT_567430 [Daldinia bambusicola]|nr:hypothetical protein F4811DRAFT_567430 [Daldinia bambusicola]
MDTIEKRPVHLPTEIIFQIMSSLLPTDEKAYAPRWHEATKLLLAFSRVSRATHSEATRKLRQQCIFISMTRTPRFLRSLTTFRQSKFSLPSAFTNIKRMYLNIIGDESLGRTLKIFNHLEELACTIDILLMAGDPHNRDIGKPLWPNLERLAIIKYYIGFDLSWLFAQSRQLNHIVLKKAVKPEYYLQILPREQEELSYELPETPITVAISEDEYQSIQEQYAEDDRLRVLKYALQGERSSCDIFRQAVI